MGKKSKRRGNGGCKKSHGGGDADQPLVSHEALMQVTAPKSLKGIFSTNEHPTRCVFCDKFSLDDYIIVPCCGKIRCGSCQDNFVDICGNYRCAACNTLTWKRQAILQSEAASGKAWAHMFIGATLAREGMHNEALASYARSAMRGNFDAFLALSCFYREGRGLPQDLKLSATYARKARALNPDCGLSSNYCLLRIAELHITARDDNAAITLLLDIAKESNENALDGDLCSNLAAHFWNNDKLHLSAVMYARSFCHGRIESAHSASYMFGSVSKFAVSKLFFDVASRSKSLFPTIDILSTGEKMTWQDLQPQRDEIRAALRILRSYCGGCGVALSGEMRKYCRCCRTYCYCNQNCQKTHWGNGHREECKEVEGYMREIQRAIRAGKFDWTLEKE